LAKANEKQTPRFTNIGNLNNAIIEDFGDLRKKIIKSDYSLGSLPEVSFGIIDEDEKVIEEEAIVTF